MTVGIAVLLVLVLFLFIVVATGVRIVRPYQRGILEQLGKFKATRDPGLHVIIPFIQSLRLVDMREQVIDVPPQEVITSDNVVVSVDAVVFYEPTDPQRLVYNIANFILAITKLAQTNLRNVIGDLTLDEALTSRDKLNQDLRLILDDATDKWGVRVVRVEIQRIDPPPDVMNAMHEQMKAERNRRAQVLTADGIREAAIMRAEGEKQGAILEAEGVRQRQILEAEGQALAARELADAERYRQETIAAGEASAIRAVYGAIHDGNPTDDLIAIKYLETLEQVADGRATKIFLPLHTAAITGALGGLAELFKGDDPSGNGRTGKGTDQPAGELVEAVEGSAAPATGASDRPLSVSAAAAEALAAQGVPEGWTPERWARYQVEQARLAQR